MLSNARARAATLIACAALLNGCGATAEASGDKRACDVVGRSMARLTQGDYEEAAEAARSLQDLVDDVEREDLKERILLAATFGPRIDNVGDMDTDEFVFVTGALLEADTMCIDKGLL